VNNTDAFRDKTTGRFLTGNNGGGRKRGARNRLSEAFLEDLQALWERQGEAVLERAARENPVAMTKIIAGILPREVLVRAFTTKTEINLFAEMDLSDAVRHRAKQTRRTPSVQGAAAPTIANGRWPTSWASCYFSTAPVQSLKPPTL
jgi:hypothetical protein